jgi:class 3 adenylate cyclase/alpha-beta hydrolase superfamily lysophospholipase
MVPETHYVASGNVHIAYQVVGEGPIDLVFVPSWLSHVEHLWAEPRIARMLNGLASFSRLILFDRRGTGLSDGTTGASPLDEQIDDVRAVLDAAGSTDPAMFSIAEGCAMATLFAASHPDLVRALVLYTPMPRLIHAPDYPWASTPTERAARLRPVLDHWGRGAHIDWFAPSASDDESLRRWWAVLERYSMGPSTAAAHFATIAKVDVRDVLPSVQCPTLVMRRAGDTLIDARHSRYTADHIPGARYLELPGTDNFLGVGDFETPLREIGHFLTGTNQPISHERVLATVLFTDIVGSTERAARLGDQRWHSLLDGHDRLVRERVERERGRLVKSLGDGALAVFDAPSRAIASAVAIRDGVRDLGLEIRAGLHTGECELRGDEDVGGIAVHIGARVSGLAAPGEVLVSGTVHDLVVGSDIRLTDHGEHSLKGVPGAWRTYAVAA